jgi:hypothetical protein
MNIPHCKECAAYLFYQLMGSQGAPPKLPVLRGPFNRNMFMVGSIGATILLVGGPCIGLSMLIGQTWSQMPEYPWPLILLIVLFSLGLALSGIGFYGFHRNYGSIMGLVSCVLLIVTAFITPLSTFFSIHESEEWSGEISYRIGLEIIASFVFIGICLILMGTTLVLVRNYTMNRNLSTASGIVSIFVAGLFLTIFPAIFLGIAWFLTLVPSILIALVFDNAKTPPITQNDSQFKRNEITPRPEHGKYR